MSIRQKSIMRAIKTQKNTHKKGAKKTKESGPNAIKKGSASFRVSAEEDRTVRFGRWQKQGANRRVVNEFFKVTDQAK